MLPARKCGNNDSPSLNTVPRKTLTLLSPSFEFRNLQQSLIFGAFEIQINFEEIWLCETNLISATSDKTSLLVVYSCRQVWEYQFQAAVVIVYILQQ